MALRMSEEEFEEWKRKRDARLQAGKTGSEPGTGNAKTRPGDIRKAMAEIGRPVRIPGASPSCCQPARSSGVSLEEMEEKPEKRSKYGNRRTEVDGLAFDSKHEAQVYCQLMERVKAGELKCVWRQVKFDLGGGPNASRDSRYAYYADFVTVDWENRVEVIDAKSEATRQNRTYINKKKEVLAVWGLEIREM